MSHSSILTRPSKTTEISAWSLQILLAVIYLAAASAKLAGLPMMVDVFAQIGLGQWFRYVTAAVEIVGAIALVVPGFAVGGAALLGVTMICAVAAHVVFLHSSPVPPLVLLVLDAIVLWLRRGQIGPLLRRLG